MDRTEHSPLSPGPVQPRRELPPEATEKLAKAWRKVFEKYEAKTGKRVLP